MKDNIKDQLSSLREKHEKELFQIFQNHHGLDIWEATQQINNIVKHLDITQ